MKIYTKTGDDGNTSLYGGVRTGKDDLRVEAYGTVDELNSAVGVILSQLRKNDGAGPGSDLTRIQHHLFRLGAELADPKGKAKSRKIGQGEIEGLETAIDGYEENLPALTQFILPGGSPAASSAHKARSVARRAERVCVNLARRDEISPHIIVYLNRLSDFLFVLARAINREEGVEDTPWDAEV
ncbi:MAG: cob(I)yrinic acid a,c-diamide adenosyltransferase [Gemmatimonadetes bacterium]|nr:cob(I)yrinic acid a,c-diamide adenosyltransferase [Gemmatimonadota bacterium]